MKWIEVIQVRLNELDRSVFNKRLDGLMEDIKTRNDIKLVIYRQFYYKSDIRIHLYHNDSQNENGSPLGLHLASAFKEYGLVDHSIWVEVKQ